MFFAGPNVTTYRARTPNGGRFIGVRCVKFANYTERPASNGVSFVWYGEGLRNSLPYRHFGEVFQCGAERYGHGAYLEGNGEQVYGHADALTFAIEPVSTTLPERIFLRGDWEEDWEREPSGLITEYTSGLAPITTAGAWFDHFAVLDITGTHGEGQRFMLLSGSWLGSGIWRGAPYLHLGTYIGDPAAHRCPIAIGAADICFQRGFCSKVEWGTMLIRPATGHGVGALETVGDWTEVWTLQRRRRPCRVTDGPQLPFRK
jgi:hypothetical protein